MAKPLPPDATMGEFQSGCKFAITVHCAFVAVRVCGAWVLVLLHGAAVGCCCEMSMAVCAL